MGSWTSRTERRALRLMRPFYKNAVLGWPGPRFRHAFCSSIHASAHPLIEAARLAAVGRGSRFPFTDTATVRPVRAATSGEGHGKHTAAMDPHAAVPPARPEGAVAKPLGGLRERLAGRLRRRPVRD